MTTPSPAAEGVRARFDTFVHRYELDRTRPTFAEARADLARRALAPAVGLFAAVVVVGLLIVGPLDSLPGEAAVNEELQKERTPILNQLTAIWSGIGNTEFIIGGCVLAIGLFWWRTREWWVAIIPGIAVAVQAAVFMLSALVVGRERPDVEHLDEAPPTSGFPSGHTGASVAFYLSVALLARRIRNRWLRYVVTTLCVAVPVLVAYARLYRGMHHPTDVGVGAVNGLVCVVLGWRYLSRRPAPEAADTPGEVAELVDRPGQTRPTRARTNE